MPQATTKTYQLFRETLLNSTSDEHKKTFFRFCGCGDRLCEECVRGIEDEIPEEIRQITLEDVLLALENSRDYNDDIISILPGGDIIRETLFDIGENNVTFHYVCNWQLTKPAHLQSEETLLAIINLLK